MKKIKLLLPLMAIPTLSTMLVPLTSCKTKDKAKTIEIEVKPIVVGQPATIKYTLASNYALDVVNSSITFVKSDSNTNLKVNLVQCKVDTATNTVVVPAEFVISTTVTVDFKTEETSKAVKDLTEDQYKHAWDVLMNIYGERCFSSTANGWNVQMNNEQVEYYTTYADTFAGLGFFDYSTENKVQYNSGSTSTAVYERYSYPYDATNREFWSYCKYSETGGQEGEDWRTTYNTWTQAFFHEHGLGYREMFTQLRFDAKLNAYYYEINTTGDPYETHGKMYFKFTKINNVPLFASFNYYAKDTYVHEAGRYAYMSDIFTFDYNTPTIKSFERGEKGKECVHDKWDLANKKLTCQKAGNGYWEVDKNDLGLILEDKTKSLVIDNYSSSWLSSIYIGNNLLVQGTDFEILEVSSGRYKITIKPEALTKYVRWTDDLVMCDQSVGGGSASGSDKYLEIYQE